MDNTNQTESLSTQEYQQKTDKKSIKIKINIKTVVIAIVIIVVGVSAYFFKGLFIVALVDGSPISRLTIIHTLEKASGKSLLDSLITEKLIQKEADTKGITVSNDEINVQITTIQDQIAAQGSTLDAELAAQGMTMDDLKKKIVLQKEVEQLVADQITVSDAEVTQYIRDNAITIPTGQEATITAQIKDQLRSQKLSTAGDELVTSLRSRANIDYFVNY